MELEKKYYHVNHIHLHTVAAGPRTGKVLIFLHGFPEFWWGWRHQIPFFAAAGYRVVVPDQRGYNLSSKPGGVKAYAMQQLTADIAALIKQLGLSNVILIGHDWGGAVAWTMAMDYPELVDKLVVLNMPHPAVMIKHLKKRSGQMFRSAYIGFFQLPLVPELLLKAFDFKLLATSMQKSARSGTFAQADLLPYQQAWAATGALRSMIHWYRAAFHSLPRSWKDIQQPMLLIWGKKDKFLNHAMAPESISRCKNGRLEMIPDATHWVQHDRPEKVNQLILDFLCHD